MGLMEKIFGDLNAKEVKKIEKIVDRIEAYDEAMQALSDDELRAKTQEFKERKTYKPEISHLTHNGPLPDGEITTRLTGKYTRAEAPAKSAAPAAEAAAAPATSGARKPILFKTATCPNCRIAISYLDKAGFPYEALLANENADLAVTYGVKQAPTLIVFADDGSYTKYAGAGAIKGFLNENASVSA